MVRFGRKWFLLACVFLASGPRTGEAQDYSVQAIDVSDGDTCLPLAEDLDGDARAELLVWDGHVLRFFVMDADGFFAGDGDPVELPEDVCLFDVSDRSGAGNGELIFLTRSGMFTSRFNEGGFAPPVKLLDAACDLPGGTIGPLDLAIDMTGEGHDDLWYVSGDTLVAHVGSPDKVMIWKGPLVRADDPVKPNGLPFRVHILDLDGDAEEDVLCVTPDGLSAFRLETGPDGCSVSAAWHLPFAPYLDKDDAREIVDENLDDVALFEDVTGDGRKEFFLSSWSRGRVYLFRGEEAWFETEPFQVLDVGPVVTGVSAVRSDDSDAPSLLIHRFEPPSIPGALFRVVTRRKITVKFDFLLFEPSDSPGSLYPEQPTVSRRISVAAKKGDQKKIEPRFVIGDADFNGDGWNDLAVLTDASSVRFHWARDPDAFGRKDEIPPMFTREQPPPMSLAEFSRWTHDLMVEHFHLESPGLQVQIPSPQGFMIRRQYARDLNADGIDDLMLPYLPIDDEGSCRLVVLLSRR